MDCARLCRHPKARHVILLMTRCLRFDRRGAVDSFLKAKAKRPAAIIVNLRQLSPCVPLRYEAHEFPVKFAFDAAEGFSFEVIKEAADLYDYGQANVRLACWIEEALAQALGRVEDSSEQQADDTVYVD